ncbi:hypothetical protein Tco_0197627, partial [Tanacetum coccineum]
IVTNPGRASTLAATDAATPTLRHIERAAIAAATPITYHSKCLFLSLSSLFSATKCIGFINSRICTSERGSASSSLAYQTSGQESSSVQIQWPSGRSSHRFLATEKPKQELNAKQDSSLSSKRRPLVISSVGVQSKMTSYFQEYPSPSSSKTINFSKKPP